MHYHRCQTKKLEDCNNLIITIVVDLMVVQYKPNNSMEHPEELQCVPNELTKHPQWMIYFLVSGNIRCTNLTTVKMSPYEYREHHDINFTEGNYENIMTFLFLASSHPSWWRESHVSQWWPLMVMCKLFCDHHINVPSNGFNCWWSTFHGKGKYFPAIWTNYLYQLSRGPSPYLNFRWACSSHDLWDHHAGVTIQAHLPLHHLHSLSARDNSDAP